jgi:polyisoprenoid-binding protein YceI
MNRTAVDIPGYVAGTWAIDPDHSEVAFTVRHMMVSKFRGRFDEFEGTIVTTENMVGSSVTVSVDASSINTHNEMRDGHIRAADIFDVEKHPSWAFTSTAVRDLEGGRFMLDGDITITGVTEPVTFEVELNGIHPDPYGGTRIGFSARTEINRYDFGVSFNGPLPGPLGGVIISEQVTVNVEIEAILQRS